MKAIKRSLIVGSLIVLSASGLVLFAQIPTYDVVIHGGRIIDGTGNPWFSGDVAIKDGRIAAVGRLAGVTAARSIDATGMAVAPGFIDLHTHSDLSLVADGNAESAVRDGVTLDVTGESTSVAPRDGLPIEESDSVRQDWRDFTQYFHKVEQQRISINLIAHVSAEQIRRVVIGYDDRAASAAEIERMQSLVVRSMKEGAWGLVTRFESGGPDHPDEIMAMAKTTASLGGNYTTHMGSEGHDIFKEVAFAIRVAEEARLPVHIFHVKIRGRESWGSMPNYLEQVEEARRRGLDITANQYPYTAMSKPWNTFFPLWARAGGPAKFAERLKDPALRAKIKRDPDFITWVEESGGWEGTTMSSTSLPPFKKYEGLSITEIAKLRGDADPTDTCLDLMAGDSRIGGVYFNQSEENVRMVMPKPWVAIASDGGAINLNERGLPHPRLFSTNARVLGHYVRDEHLLTLEEAIRKMTSFPAQILGLADRGQIRRGFAGDVVVFDPATIRETNSFEKPKSYPEGIPYVLVNGALVIDKGQHTGARPGKVIRGRGFNANST
jgi:N-acyl-D-amino-acid deacylase